MHSGKFAVALLSLIIIGLILTTPVQAQGTPHVIFGLVKDEQGNPTSAAQITLRNQRTGGELTIPADSMGQYQTDLGAVPGGYQVGDTIEVRASSGELQGRSTVTVTAGPMDQCDVVVSPAQDWVTFVYLGIIGAVTIVIIGAFLIFRPKEPGKPKGKAE